MTRNLITGTAALLYYIVAFMCAGFVVPKKWRGSEFYDVFLLGFPLYYAVFQIVGLSMKLLDMPLHVLTWTWLGLLLAAAVFVILRRRAEIPSYFAAFGRDIKKYRAERIFLILALAVAVILVINSNHLSYYDHSYYVGIVQSSVWSDTIEQVDVYTGMAPNGQRAFYLLSTDTVQNAVVCSIFRVHALVHADYTLTAVYAGMFFLYLRKAGMLLFQDERRKMLCFTFFAALILFFSYSAGGTSMYFALRPYEGKAVVSYLVLPAVFTFFLVLYNGRNRPFGRIGLFALAVSSVAFTNSAVYITPVLITALLAPYCIYRKSWREAAWLLLMLVPCLLWIVAHMFLE